MALLDALPLVRSWTSLMNCDAGDGSRARFSTPVAHRFGRPHQRLRRQVTRPEPSCALCRHTLKHEAPAGTLSHRRMSP